MINREMIVFFYMNDIIICYKKKNEVLKKRKTSKTQSTNSVNMMIDDLIRKMKALVLQISTMSEAVINQTRILVL